MAEQITIPDELYVGFNIRSNYDTETYENIPYRLGFIVPYGTDSGAKKRIETVTNWSSGNEKPETHTNELLEGYSIPQFIYRSHWGGSNILWRIKDPRNFEFEISCANLAKILECTTIINGVIQGKCIIGRSGAKNVLLPEKSEPYQNALVTTTVSKMEKISKKDINVGDILLLSDESMVVYYGQYYAVIKKEDYPRRVRTGRKEDSGQNRELIVSKSKYFLVGHFLKKEHIGSDINKQYINISSDLKVVSKIGFQPDAEKIITEYINSAKTINHNLKGTLITVIKEKLPVKLSLEKCDDAEIKNKIKGNEIDFIVGKYDENLYGMYINPWGRQSESIDTYNFSLVDDTHGIYYHGYKIRTSSNISPANNYGCATIPWASDPNTPIEFYHLYVLVGDKKFSAHDMFRY